jgi:glucose-1-phosphate thymidylyltransferase
LGKLPFSKELLALRPAADDPFVASPGTRVAIEDSLQVLTENGVRDAYIVIAPGKEDIPAYLETNPVCGIDVTFLCRDSSPSVPHTLSTAIPYLGDQNIILIFPDIVFHPRNAIARTVAEHAAHDADVTLGLVPSIRGDKVDIVTLDQDGNVLAITPKPGAGIHGWTWITAAWSSDFSAFLQDYTDRGARAQNRELFVGDVMNAAMQSGLAIGGLSIPDGSALDIGTPEDLKSLMQRDFLCSKESS